MSKIAFINTLKVPSGEASVNRILSLAKGLVECGDEVDIITSNVNPDYANGEKIDGVRIYNLGTSNGIAGLTIALNRIIHHLNRERYKAVISTTNSLLLIYPLAATCKFIGSKLIQEKSEFPFSLMKKGFVNRIYSHFYVNTTYKLMDAMIIMTIPLLEYFKDKVRKNCQFIHLPMTVDSSRFDISKTQSDFGDYIAYCGNMSGNKDGVENLIDAFGFVLEKNPQLKLLLIGGTDNDEELLKLKQKAAKISLDNIIFYGKASRDIIPSLLKNAKILALARPSGLQSLGGFPTKLGEYLSTGNPVVVTAVGDIPNYLNDKNSFIVEPDNNKAFGEAISQAYKNPKQSTLIGQEGYKLVQSTFEYQIQTKKLHNFIDKLK